MTQRFEWDEVKAATNVRKHGVPLERQHLYSWTLWHTLSTTLIILLGSNDF